MRSKAPRPLESGAAQRRAQRYLLPHLHLFRCASACATLDRDLSGICRPGEFANVCAAIPRQGSNEGVSRSDEDLKRGIRARRGGANLELFAGCIILRASYGYRVCACSRSGIKSVEITIRIVRVVIYICPDITRSAVGAIARNGNGVNEAAIFGGQIFRP